MPTVSSDHEEASMVPFLSGTDTMDDAADNGFFDFQVSADLYAQLSHDLFGEILSWIPAYPYLYSLRRVCKKWKRELEERIFEQRVQLLDLLQTDRSADEHKGYKNFVEFKEVQVDLPVDEDAGAITTKQKKGKRGRANKPTAAITRDSVIEFLGTCFPNVKTLRIQLDRGMHWQETEKKCTNEQVKTILDQFPQIEHLLILILPIQKDYFRLEFVTLLTEALSKKSSLQTLTIAGLDASSNWKSTAQRFSTLESLPQFRSVELKFALSLSELDWKLASPTKNIASGSHYNFTSEDSLLEYCRYMLEKLRIPSHKLVYNDQYFDTVSALEAAISGGMVSLVRYLLPFFEEPSMRTLATALNNTNESDNFKAIQSILLDNEVKHGTDLLDLASSLVRYGGTRVALKRILDRLPQPLPYDRLYYVFKTAVSGHNIEYISYFVDKHLEELKRVEGFDQLLLVAARTYREGSLTTFHTLVKQCGLSLSMCDEDCTVMVYLLEQVFRVPMDKETLEPLFQFLHRNATGGLPALLVRQVSGDSYSALRVIAHLANNYQNHRHCIDVVQMLVDMLTPQVFWLLREEESNLSLLQLFANISNFDDKSDELFSSFLVGKVLEYSSAEEIRSTLESTTNSLLFKKHIRNNFDQTLIDAQMGMALGATNACYRHAVLYSLLTDTSADVFSTVTEYITQKYYGNDILNLLMLKNSGKTVLHVLAARKEEANEKRLRSLLEACGDARKDQRIVNLVNLKNYQACTALHLAVYQGQIDNAIALIHHGADTTAKNLHQKTPLNFAKGQMRQILKKTKFDPTKKNVKEPKSYQASGASDAASNGAASSAAAAVTTAEAAPAATSKRRGRKRKQPSSSKDDEVAAQAESSAEETREDGEATSVRTQRRKRVRKDK